MKLLFLCECNKNKCFSPGNFGGASPAFLCFLKTESTIENKAVPFAVFLPDQPDSQLYKA